MSYVTGSKKTHFFVRKLTVDKLFEYFEKMSLTQASIHSLWLESSHSVKNVIRVKSS